jgi:hypothetical protein
MECAAVGRSGGGGRDDALARQVDAWLREERDDAARELDYAIAAFACAAGLIDVLAYIIDRCEGLVRLKNKCGWLLIYWAIAGLVALPGPPSDFWDDFPEPMRVCLNESDQKGRAVLIARLLEGGSPLVDRLEPPPAAPLPLAFQSLGPRLAWAHRRSSWHARTAI